ncbi:unnamed protein product [Diabrotica balteata]|uniref:Cuticle protein n=1 Tax=Diabrotica balteata TaxID=107213 RepID=A0A9N9T3N9_DIABA|nr:unnamed protein product [Diabrotica balteata]
MNSLVIVAIFSCLALANAGTIVQGPSAKSTVVGADGSVISAVAPGGQIIAEEHPGVVAHSAPLVAAYSHPVVAAHASPIVAAYSAPLVNPHAASVVSVHSAPIVAAHAAPVVSAYSHPVVAAPLVAAHSAPVVAHGVVNHREVDTVVAGPSGTITTSKLVASPAVVPAYGVVGHGVHGQYY